MIESETDSVNAIGRELANGKEKGTAADIAEDLIAATKVEDREITEVAAGTDCTVIGAETVIATEIDIETGEKMRKDLSLKSKNKKYFKNAHCIYFIKFKIHRHFVHKTALNSKRQTF